MSMRESMPHWPRGLMKKPAAQAFWRETISKMQARGTWDDAWIQIVELAADARQDYEDAAAEVARLNLLVKAGSGGVKINPAVAAKKAAGDTVIKVLAELGLTPTAAARFSNGECDDDQFANFVKRPA